MDAGSQAQKQTFLDDDRQRRVQAPADAAVAGRIEPDAGAQAPAPAKTGGAETIELGDRSFRVGDIILDAAAADDVRLNEKLFTGIVTEEVRKAKQRLRDQLDKPLNKKQRRKAEEELAELISRQPSDQHHVLVHDRRLGYELAHQDPYDPFRWSKLREILERGHLDIFATSGPFTARVPDKDGKLVTVSPDLDTLRPPAAGVTLPRREIAEKLWAWERGMGTVFTPTSNVDDRDQIFYRLRSNLGENALAHELFGHIWLLLQPGVPWLHPEHPDKSKKTLTPLQRGTALLRIQRFGTLRAEHLVSDPFGNPFEGTVEDFINYYAGASIDTISSPTHWVSSQRLTQALEDMHRRLTPAAMGWSGTTANFLAEQLIGWAYLANNYRILTYRLKADPSKRKEWLLGQIVDQWFGKEFDAKQKEWFRRFVSTAAEWGLGVPRQLSDAVRQAIGDR